MAKRYKEFELKFTGSPGVVAALPGGLFFSALSQDKGEWSAFKTTYYDTPNGVLHGAGLSLCVRDSAGRLRQTVKRSLQNGLNIEREQIDCPLQTAKDFPAKTGAIGTDELIAQNAADLRSIARMEVDRWAVLVGFKSSQIEIAVDLGRSCRWQDDASKAGAILETPLAEVSLKLRSGAPKDLYGMARLLARQAPLRLRVNSKVEAVLFRSRGDFGKIPSWKNIDVRPEESGADLLRAALAGVAARMVHLQPALVDMRRGEAVQQMRVILRRLQVLERIFRPYLKSKHLIKLVETARLVARQLGAARDWDVFTDETMPLVLRNKFPACDSARLHEAVQRKRAEGWANAVATVNDADFTVFLIDLMEMATLSPWMVNAKKLLSMKVADLAPRTLDRSLKKTKAVVAKTRFDMPSDLHRLRLALKKHRYSVQTFRALYPKAQRQAYMKELSLLQKWLGTVTDAEVGQRLVNEAAIGNGDDAMRAAGFICGYKAAQAEAAVAKIRVRLPVFISMEVFWRG